MLAPTEGDAGAIANVLGQGGFEVSACEDVRSLADEIARGTNDEGGAVGAVILAQEALVSDEPAVNGVLARALSSQAEWSDLPLILLAGGPSGGDGAWEIARRLDPVGNITILERPLRRTTLLNAARVALRVRARQYAMRATLIELAQHREHLHALVEQRTAELAASTAKLYSAERLAALGSLAAGLGHDLANLTLPIRVRLDALRASCPGPEAKADLDAIGMSLTHLGNLSAGMRLLALDPRREGASAPATDLDEWAAETTPMLRAVLPRFVCLKCDVAPGLGVSVPRHQLAQAVFNLVQNAGEAMAGRSRGEVRIDARPGHGPSGAAMVVLRIIDDGPGMTPEVLARCFDPYFSTKARTIATGMGLGMVKGIVEAAGGTVTVESAPGRGAAFTLMLPAASVPRPPRRELCRTGAVSVAHRRTAGLACLFLKELDVACVRHHGRDAPSALLWVLDDPDPARIAGYLREDRRRGVVVLGDRRTPAGRSLADACPECRDRIHAIPGRPTAGALRDALVAMCPQATDARSGG